MVAMMLRASRAFARASRTSTRRVSRSLSSAVPLLKRGDGCEALQVGETYHNFTLKRKTSVPEYNIDALELEHVRTKANYLHIDANDTNNVFSVTFRTPPYSSNGVAHILEHMVLCGSHQFPVRDPFFSMAKRSLNTSMNALTADDHTMYPFSTVNAKDLDNLRAVYLDAVFFPILHRLDFLQEGHRLQLVDVGGGTLKLQFNGVVYNEMKGNLADALELFDKKIRQTLMEGTIYSHISGGDPVEIPDLTYNELKGFHAKHYHPSNALFYSYGDLPLTEHLQYLDENIMSRFEYHADSAAVRVDNNVPKSQVIKRTGSEPLVIVDGPMSSTVGTEGNERYANMKFCMTKYLPIASTDPFETFMMRILSYLLVGSPSSELYKALIESGLARDFSVGTGLNMSTFYPSFGVSVEGIEGDHVVPEIQDAIKRAYESVVENGFDKKRVDALLHQVELNSKHIDGDFGMNLMRIASSVWTHRGDLTENLQLNPLLERLEREMQANPKFLEHYVRDFLLRDDTKQVQVLMRPKESYVSDQEVKEAQRLADLLMEQSNNDLDRIGKTAKELEKYQKKPQPVECLPTLTLADIPVTAEDNFDFVDTERISTSEVPTQFVKVPTTNEISYVRVLFDMTGLLPTECQPFVPLLTSVLGSLGTSRLGSDALSTTIQNCSDGISCSGLSHPSLSDAATTSYQSILIETHCLPHKLNDTLRIVHELLADTLFLDPENLKQLRILLQMQATTAGFASLYAAKYSCAGFTYSGLYQEFFSGYTQLELLQKWSRASDEELVEIATMLQMIARAVFTPDNMRLSVVTEDKLRGQVSTALEHHLVNPLQRSVASSTDAEFPSHEIAPIPSLTLSPRTFFGFPMSVNYVVETFPSVAFAHLDHVPLTVLAQVMSSCFLHQQIRDQGGAYGCRVSQGEGTFSLSSSDDPNTLKTLEVYEKALQWAVDGKFTDRDVQEALLSTFAVLDAPKTPSIKGKEAFVRGITNEVRQERREQFLSLSKTQLVDVAARYFGEKPSSHAVIFGNASEAQELDRAGFHVKLC
ncbi:hypothetical protein Poli38472_009995 [Pythium oligandrum]|uniref:Peptidase M16C associated domain-containing protein n=1 Tax=Pythium oligandrum TaxID=41045 RepID=A0A8K1C8N3_PYTOL|nr:hypothetical protein Poli38472_009995 [Pythium oligandrum]|eukprot:TMW58436.1 hypothetical protein Poli38472_009995 [Pythium oligandrum]